uniref:Uncharacterized protein n=1 Tax=Ixodes ricinus TaxID=34613 RepID=A0A6B0V347_IXORI
MLFAVTFSLAFLGATTRRLLAGGRLRGVASSPASESSLLGRTMTQPPDLVLVNLSVNSGMSSTLLGPLLLLLSSGEAFCPRLLFVPALLLLAPAALLLLLPLFFLLNFRLLLLLPAFLLLFPLLFVAGVWATDFVSAASVDTRLTSRWSSASLELTSPSSEVRRGDSAETGDSAIISFPSESESDASQGSSTVGNTRGLGGVFRSCA